MSGNVIGKNLENSPRLGSLELNWQQQGDEFTEKLEPVLLDNGLRLRGLRESRPGKSWPTRIVFRVVGDGWTVRRRKSFKAKLHWELLGLASGDSTEIFGPKEDDGTARTVGDRFMLCATKAVKLLGTHKEYSWVAVIGHPPERQEERDVRLTTSASINGIQLESAERLLIDVIPNMSKYPAMAPRRHVPLFARGHVQSYSDVAASLLASRIASTLCGALSVAWNAPLTTRDLQVDQDHYELQGPPEYALRYTQDKSFMRLRGNRVYVPNWLGAALDRLEDDPALQGSVDIYVEGLMIAVGHPSLACVCYATAIESVASRMYKKERGAGKAFGRMIEHVLPGQGDWLGELYVTRSKTVHSGHLYGFEGVRGAFGWLNPTVEDSLVFVSHLMQLQDAARAVLEWALTSEEFLAAGPGRPKGGDGARRHGSRVVGSAPAD